ncbi:MAG: hypothetical protein H6719_16345 [Sandaracinaceae bacterium]|nr:hypothetical protein [Sandaracinaceae bacterium]
MRATARSSLVIAALTLAGCGDGRPASGADGSAPPAADAGIVADLDATSPGVDAGGGANPFAGDLFPLAMGLEWEWRATRTDGTPGTGCDDSGTHTGRIVEVREEAEGTVYVRDETPGCYFDTLPYRRRGEDVDVQSGGAWYVQLDLPPTLGGAWAAGGASGATYEWSEHHDTYTVAAGTFTDCWTRQQQGYDVWEVYCAGVGMVESHYAAWGGDSRMELVRTSF